MRRPLQTLFDCEDVLDHVTQPCTDFQQLIHFLDLFAPSVLVLLFFVREFQASGKFPPCEVHVATASPISKKNIIGTLVAPRRDGLVHFSNVLGGEGKLEQRVARMNSAGPSKKSPTGEGVTSDRGE